MARSRLPAAWRRLNADARAKHRVLRHVRRRVRANGSLPPPESAEVAGLRYVTDRARGIRRLGRPKRFRYVGADGRPLRDTADLARRALRAGSVDAVHSVLEPLALTMAGARH